MMFFKFSEWNKKKALLFHLVPFCPRQRRPTAAPIAPARSTSALVPFSCSTSKRAKKLEKRQKAQEPKLLGCGLFYKQRLLLGQPLFVYFLHICQSQIVAFLEIGHP